VRRVLFELMPPRANMAYSQAFHSQQETLSKLRSLFQDWRCTLPACGDLPFSFSSLDLNSACSISAKPAVRNAAAGSVSDVYCVAPWVEAETAPESILEST
jgi:hypothetical protein